MKLFRSSAYFFAFAFIICINGVFSKSESEDSYAKHCSSVIPLYITARSNGSSLPYLSTSYFAGGNRLERMELGWIHNNAARELSLRLLPNPYQTTAAGVYNVQGLLYITFTYRGSGDDYQEMEIGPFEFPMKGFWSEKSRKLCMVGSTSLKAIDVGAVLKLKFDDENPSIYTAVVSGSLESTAPANYPAFFDSILIFKFPEAPNYNYSLVSEETGAAFPSRRADSLSLDSNLFCSVMQYGLSRLELEYATACAERRRPHGCSPLDEFLPNHLSLSSIQCEEGAKKARFLATFQNYFDYENKPTAIGEAWWDDKSNRINGVACKISNPLLQLGNSVGDCTIRLSLSLPLVLNLRDDAIIEGEIWSSKAAEDSGFFRRINLTISNGVIADVALRPYQRYKYTELDRVRISCSHQKKKKKGMSESEYPDGKSDDMRLFLNVTDGDGRTLAWGTATPVWVENGFFNAGKDTESAAITWPTRMSYRIAISLVSLYDSSSIGRPVSYPSRDVVITAEGLYDAETGHLCMVGCTGLMLKNSLSAFKDCEIIVELELPVLSGERGRNVKGVIRSRRAHTDPLHFDDLMIDDPHYRAHNYPKYEVNTTYYYANPAADLYSTAWDIIIPFGIIASVAIVFVQQRYSGRSKVL